MWLWAAIRLTSAHLRHGSPGSLVLIVHWVNYMTSNCLYPGIPPYTKGDTPACEISFFSHLLHALQSVEVLVASGIPNATLADLQGLRRDYSQGLRLR